MRRFFFSCFEPWWVVASAQPAVEEVEGGGARWRLHAVGTQGFA